MLKQFFKKIQAECDTAIRDLNYSCMIFSSHANNKYTIIAENIFPKGMKNIDIFKNSLTHINYDISKEMDNMLQSISDIQVLTEKISHGKIDYEKLIKEFSIILSLLELRLIALQKTIK